MKANFTLAFDTFGSERGLYRSVAVSDPFTLLFHFHAFQFCLMANADRTVLLRLGFPVAG